MTVFFLTMIASLFAQTVDGRDFFPLEPGSSWHYKVTVTNGKDYIAGNHWVSFEDAPEDSLFAYLYSSDGPVTGVGRYFNQGGDFLMMRMRNISGDSGHRGLFDFLSLPVSFVNGAVFGAYSNLKYTVSVDPSLNKIRLEFDSTASGTRDMVGTGYIDLERGVGIVAVSFTSTLDGVFGPSGSRVTYELISHTRVGKKTISGTILNADGTPAANAAVALGTFWLNPPDAYKPVARTDGTGTFVISAYVEENVPVLLSYGLDADGNWDFDTMPAGYKLGSGWKDGRIDVGTLVLE